MLSSIVDTANNEKLSRREPARAAGQQQQQRSRGACGQLQGKVWDPGGFQHWKIGAHDQEIMIFPDKYDVGASLHVSSVPANQHIQHTFNGERERRIPLNFEIQNFNKCCKDFNARPRLCIGSG
jgi:hypothetical protein